MSQDPSQQPDPDFQEQEPVQSDAESTSESTQSTQLTEEKLKQLPAWLRKEITDFLLQPATSAFVSIFSYLTQKAKPRPNPHLHL
jgi:hypothetical protein